MANLDREIFSLLIEACKDDDLEHVKKYLSQDNIEGTDLYTPIWASISLRKYNVLEYLLIQGANPNRILPFYLDGMCDYEEPPDREYKYSTYLHYAIFEEVRYFVFITGDDPITKDMHISIESLKILIKYGADINKKNEKGETPLDMAVCQYHHTAIEYLKSLGAKTSKELEEENKVENDEI